MANEDYKVPLHAAWLLRHVNGCGEPAFYLSQEPVFGMAVVAEQVWYPDGTQPKHGDPFKCGSCQAPLNDARLDVVIQYCEKRGSV